MINKFLYPNGGSETYIFNLGKALSEAGHEVQYFGMEHEGRCVGNDVNAYTADMEFHSGSAFTKITYPVKTIYSKEARKKIRLVLENFKPDVCHLNNFNYQLTPSVILEIRKWEKESGHRVRIIYTAHDYQLICPNHMLYNPSSHTLCEQCTKDGFGSCYKGRCIHGSSARSLIGTMEGIYWKKRKTYCEIDAVICPSEFMKKKLDLSEELRGRTLTLHNFLDMKPFSSGFDSQQDNYILYFGRLSQEKGIATLLSACRALPQIPFIFAGTGPMDAAVKEVPNVHYVGFQTGEALQQLINRARLTVYPSEWYENCPYSVMESQTMGTPVLASKIGGIPELVKAGISGELFTAGDVEDLKSHLIGMWSNPSKINRYRRGCSTVHFDTAEQYCCKILKVYKDNQQ